MPEMGGETGGRLASWLCALFARVLGLWFWLWLWPDDGRRGT
jgi:hypothetical protein